MAPRSGRVSRSCVLILTRRPLKKDGDEDYNIHRIILGTHTSNQATDQLMIAEVLLPKPNADIASKEITKVYDEDQQGRSTFSIRGLPRRAWLSKCFPSSNSRRPDYHT